MMRMTKTISLGGLYVIGRLQGMRTSTTLGGENGKSHRSVNRHHTKTGSNSTSRNLRKIRRRKNNKGTNEQHEKSRIKSNTVK